MGCGSCGGGDWGWGLLVGVVAGGSGVVGGAGGGAVGRLVGGGMVGEGVAAAGSRALRRRVSFVVWRAARPCARAAANSALARWRSVRRRADSQARVARRAAWAASSAACVGTRVVGHNDPAPGASSEKHGRGTGCLPPIAASHILPPAQTPVQRSITM
ncbi:hypothetical protein GCM10009827_064990 [Dactylosporangium maewongense]|uniref:Uncharacterized protein n=1 Tax=Dactylosporangium maewongense TaxID=634393 RepID=A0ABN2BC13_9ACTN